MTLLKMLKQTYSFTSNDIRKMLNNRILPMSLHSSALSVKNFCNALHEFGQSKIDDLANDLWSAYDISTCNDCGEYDFYDDQISCYEGDFHVCQNCCDDNYSYSDYRGTYVHYEDYDEDEGGQRQDGVYDYCHRVEDDLDFHTLPHEKHNRDTLYYGIELEVEKRRNCPSAIAYHIQDNVLCGYAQCKSDGSLENGFEICTAPMTYGKQKEVWEKFFKDKQCMDYLKGWSTDTAGLHIHISRSALKPSEIGKILVFINANDNDKFINEIAGRSSDQWAKKSPKKITDMRGSSEKYEAVNTSHSATIELRIFRSNVSKHGFYRVLEFTDALVHFTKNYTGLSGVSLHYKTFLRFMSNQDIKAQYPNLSAWLIRKGYINGKPSRQVSWQGERQSDTAN